MILSCFRSARVCAEDCVVGDLSMKKGVYVIFSAQTLHNDPELWSEPDKFDPERYTLIHTRISSVNTVLMQVCSFQLGSMMVTSP